MAQTKSEDTPMMRQFYSLKEKHPDAVLLFRCGDFYETYAQDAVEGSSGVVLESFKKGLVVLHDVERSADPALEEVVEIARLEKGLPEIADTGG